MCSSRMSVTGVRGFRETIPGGRRLNLRRRSFVFCGLWGVGCILSRHSEGISPPSVVCVRTAWLFVACDHVTRNFASVLFRGLLCKGVNAHLRFFVVRGCDLLGGLTTPARRGS